MGIYVRSEDCYPAIVSKDKGVFAARLIDLPACGAEGRTMEELRDNLSWELWRHLARFVEQARKPPVASSVGVKDFGPMLVIYVRAHIGRGDGIICYRGAAALSSVCRLCNLDQLQ